MMNLGRPVWRNPFSIVEWHRSITWVADIVSLRPPAVDKKHIGFRIVLQHLGLQALRKKHAMIAAAKVYNVS